MLNNFLLRLIITVIAISLFCSCAATKQGNPLTPEIKQTVLGIQKLGESSEDLFKKAACKESTQALENQLSTTVDNSITGSITFIGSKHVDSGFSVEKVTPCKEEILRHIDHTTYDVYFAEGFDLPLGTPVTIENIANTNYSLAKQRWEKVYPGIPDTFSLENYIVSTKKILPVNAYWVWDFQKTNPGALICGLDDRAILYCYKIARGLQHDKTAELIMHSHFYRTLLAAYSEAAQGKKVAILWGPGHEEDCKIFSDRTGISIKIITLTGCERS